MRRALLLLALIAPFPLAAQVLDHRALLTRETWWDNKDWAWYESHIPFFDSPDQEINSTYYYRWELVTKHLTYGSPESGYTFSEFIDRPFWSGAFGAISCPLGHQTLRSPLAARRRDHPGLCEVLVRDAGGRTAELQQLVRRRDLRDVHGQQ